jgi:hypothetical protein
VASGLLFSRDKKTQRQGGQHAKYITSVRDSSNYSLALDTRGGFLNGDRYANELSSATKNYNLHLTGWAGLICSELHGIAVAARLFFFFRLRAALDLAEREKAKK